MMNEEQLAASIKRNMPDLEFSVSDIKAPTGRFMQSYFTEFLLELGVHVENFQLTKNQSTTMTCPKSIGHVVPMLQLFASVDEIAKRLFIKDFSLSDITKPDPKRTLNILNRFNKFYLFADSIAEHVQSDNEELFQKKQHYHKLLEEVKNFQDMIQHQKNLHTFNDSLKQEIEDIKSRLVQKRQDLNEVSEKEEQIDAAFKEMELKHKKAVSEYEKEMHQLERLERQIVQSPDVDQVDTKLRNLEDKKKDIEKKIKELQSLMQEKTRFLNLFKKHISDMKQGAEELQAIVDCAQKNKMLDEKMQELEKRYLTAEGKEDSINDKITKLSSKLEQLDEQKNKLMIAMEKEIAAINTNVQQAQRELDEKRNEVSSQAHMSNTIEEMEKAIETKINLYNKLYDFYEDMCEKKYSELSERFDEIGLLK